MIFYSNYLLTAMSRLGILISEGSISDLALPTLAEIVEAERTGIPLLDLLYSVIQAQRAYDNLIENQQLAVIRL